MDDLTGQTLGGRYRVDTFLGRGGMADVYKVWDEQRAVYLALKVLRSDLAKDDVFLRRFQQEAEILARLQHPNIVRFYGLESTNLPGANEPLAFILMDFIHGLTLRKEIFLSKGGMLPERILEIMRPVCAALHYAHKLGMVHCDIKPANIMIHRNGTVFVADFGITRVTESAIHTPLGAGTPAYMAPEQITGQEVTPATDVYALGVMLFEMVTGGQRPFSGEANANGSSVTQKIVWEKQNLPPPSPCHYRPDLSPALEAVTLRCLQNDPLDRYTTTLELLHALEQAIQGQFAGAEMGDDLGTLADINQPEAEQDSARGDHAPTPTGTTAPEKSLPGASTERPRGLTVENNLLLPSAPTYRKSRVPQATALGVILVLFVAIGLFFARQKAPAPSLATSTPEATVVGAFATSATAQVTIPLSSLPTSTNMPAQAPTAATQAAMPSTIATALPTSVGGSQQIAFASDRSGTVQIWLMDENGDHRRQVTQARGGACQPAWSPDGKYLVYITPCNGPRITYPGANLEIINLETGETQSLNLTGGAFDPAWGPDGETILFTSLLDDKTYIGAINIKRSPRTPIVLAKRAGKNANPAWSPDGQYIAFTSIDKNIDQIWLMGKDGSSQEVFSQGGMLKYFSRPHWSPDGKTILANLKELNVNIPTLVLFNRSNPHAEETPLSKERMPMEDGSFSPDGQWVTFWTVTEGNNMEIMRISLTGELARLTHHKARDFQPAWGP